MNTLAEVRAEKRRLLHKLDGIVSTLAVADKDGEREDVLVSSLHMQQVQFAPGAFVRAAPLDMNGMAILVWEIPHEMDFPIHSHPVDETIIVLRGRLDLTIYDHRGGELHLPLTPKSCPVVVTARDLHGGKCSDRFVAVTTYEPGLSIEEALNAV